MKEHIRTWTETYYGYRLELYDHNRCLGGKWLLGYEFFFQNKLIFEGADFHCSPLHAVDSDETVAALLSFLALRPGDTDKEYFDSYTPAQLEFAYAEGEQLSICIQELCSQQ